MVDRGCRGSVNILSGLKCRNHCFITGHMGDNAQFDLTVVHRKELIAGSRGERGADLFPQLSPCRDVLQVR